MAEDKRSRRRSVKFDIVYQAAVFESGRAHWVDAKGTVMEVSENGFNMITKHMLEEGQVIMIKEGKTSDIYDFGVVKWVEKEDDHYKVGLGYKYS